MRVTVKHGQNCRPGECNCVVGCAFIAAGLPFDDEWPEQCE